MGMHFVVGLEGIIIIERGLPAVDVGCRSAAVSILPGGETKKIVGDSAIFYFILSVESHIGDRGTDCYGYDILITAYIPLLAAVQ